MKNAKVVIICNSKVRELTALMFLKSVLEKHTHSSVHIIGGLAEMQKIYFELYRIQPDIVFIPQVVEKECRKLAAYIIESRALLYVIPAEITVIKIIEEILLNPNISYKKYVTKFLIPGERFKALLEKSDLVKNQIKIVGSPKIDCLVHEEGSAFISRASFCNKYSLDVKKKNIFIFTSFVKANESYLKDDSCFDGTIKQMLESNKCVDLTKNRYISVIQKLCKDFSEYNIVLKPHPLEESESYKKIKSSNFTLITDESFYACLKSIDLAIHWSSTIAPECWIKKIKTIQFAPFPKYDSFLSESHPGNPLVRTYSELKKSIISFHQAKLEQRYKKFQQEYLQSNFYKLDGRASERISRIISNDLKLLRKTPNFSKNYSFLLPFVLSAEQIVGIKAIHRLIGFLDHNYDWKAAVENRISYK